jgi:hypothetical protein
VPERVIGEGGKMKPLLVEIIAYAPTQYLQCRGCEFLMDQAKMPGIKTFHDDALETSMPPEMMREYRALSDWVIGAANRFGGKVVFKVIDAASVEGLLKSVRYGVRKYPAVVLNGRAVHIGGNLQNAEVLIDRHLAAQIQV